MSIGRGLRSLIGQNDIEVVKRLVAETVRPPDFRILDTGRKGKVVCSRRKGHCGLNASDRHRQGQLLADDPASNRDLCHHAPEATASVTCGRTSPSRAPVQLSSVTGFQIPP